MSGITDDFVPELHDIPIGIVNACLYQNVDGLGLWEEYEEENKNKENIYDNNQNVKGGGGEEEGPESGSGSKIIIIIILLLVIIFYLLDIHLKIFEWFLSSDSSLDDL